MRHFRLFVLALCLILTLFAMAITTTSYALPPLGYQHTRAKSVWVPGHYVPGHYIYYGANGFRHRRWVYGHWVPGHYETVRSK